MLSRVIAVSRLWDALNLKNEYSVELLTLLLLTIFAVLWIFGIAKNQTRKAKPAMPPPGPLGLPLVGYLPFLGTQLHQEFSRLANIYGPIYKLWLGTKLCIVVSSPSLVKQVVRDHDLVFANRDPPIAAKIVTFGGNDIAFSPYGHNWKKLRKIFVSQMLGNTVLENSYALRRQAVIKFIRHVYANIGSPVDVGNLSFSTSINSAMSMFWGGSTAQEGIGTVSGEEFSDMTKELVVLLGKSNVSDLFPVLARFDIQGIERQAKKMSRAYERVFDYAIEQRKKMIMKKQLEGNEDSVDILQFLLRVHDGEDSTSSVTMSQIKALLMDIVVGGTDTTATTVEWVITELIQNPEAMKKVQQELTKIVGLNNLVEEFHLPKLTYLDAVIKETFRLHPALPLLVPRCSSESSIIGGYMVPKGARIFVNTWAIHRDPNIWENPLEFRPERFLNGHMKFDYTGNNFEYLPFGSGRGVCAEIPLAERMLNFVLASFLHSFEWKMPLGATLDLSDRFGIVTKKMTPLVAIPTPRLSNLELYA